jgi:mitochondrial import inner membrane translocase subunit TIM9
MRTYNAAIAQCFDDCVDSFLSKDLSGGEERCVKRCVEKYMKSFQRVGIRFAEIEASHMQLENQRLMQMHQQGQGK